MRTKVHSTAPAQAKRPRDPRLDFFRGIAMFIILLAPTPGNPWTLWIPARFGFSDATEIFVFCSGMASALAFGAVFANRGFTLGIARIGFRIWQVYWAHIGIFLFTAIMLWSIDHYGLGAREAPYIDGPWVRPLFEQTGEALIGLMTLTWISGLFDILPMYLVILGMIPAVMAVHRAGGTRAAAVLVIGTWLAANLAGFARQFGDLEDPTLWHSTLVAMGRPFEWMNLPGNPWGEGTWFFNPFGWQLVFFAGFAFGMGWLPAPPVRLWLILAAAAVVILQVPIAWYKLHYNYSLVAGTVLHDWIMATREFLEPLRWKTWQGAGRFVHFLSIAYLAWVAVGVGGQRLIEGFRAPEPPRWLVAGALAALAATLPAAYPHEIAWVIPGYDTGLDEILSFNQQGMLQLLHLAALLVTFYALIGPAWRAWLLGDGFLKAVPVIKKVGTQSLAVFTVSIPLSRFNGWVLDVIGRDVWTVAAVNLSGFGVLIGVAYLVGWLRRQPWREPRTTPPAADKPRSTSAGAAHSPALGAGNAA